MIKLRLNQLERLKLQIFKEILKTKTPLIKGVFQMYQLIFTQSRYYRYVNRKQHYFLLSKQKYLR